MTCRIRKNSPVEDVYLDRQGQWTTWEKAAKFKSQEAAEAFAVKQRSRSIASSDRREDDGRDRVGYVIWCESSGTRCCYSMGLGRIWPCRTHSMTD